MDANVESLRNLRAHLKDHGLELGRIPYVLQLNKRDLPGAVPVEQMLRLLRVDDEPVFEAVATRGVGVFETLKAIVRQVMLHLRRR